MQALQASARRRRRRVQRSGDDGWVARPFGRKIYGVVKQWDSLGLAGIGTQFQLTQPSQGVLVSKLRTRQTSARRMAAVLNMFSSVAGISMPHRGG